MPRTFVTKIAFFDKAKNFLVSPIYLYLTGILYLAYELSFGIKATEFPVIVIALLLFLIVSFLANLLLKKLLRFSHSEVFLTCCWILFLFNEKIINTAKLLVPLTMAKGRFVWAAGLIIAVLLSLLSRRLSRYNSFLNRVTNTFILIAIGISGVTSGYIMLGTYRSIKKAEQYHVPSVPAGLEKRDIVWIMMDEYSASSTLKSTFGFTNPLDTFLTNKGFHLFPNIKSRSDQTIYSVGAIFNYDDNFQPYSFGHGLYRLKKSVLVKQLNALGYDFVNFSFFEIGAKNTIEPDDIYFKYPKILHGTVAPILLSALFPKPGSTIKEYYPFKNDYNQYVLNEFYKYMSGRRQGKAKSFVYLHLFIPHAPFFKIKDGKKILTYSEEGNTNLNKRNYVEYLKYGNSVIEKLIKDFPELADKIVVISGDHGARMSYVNPALRTRPFCAIYTPRKIDPEAFKPIDYISQIPAFIFQKVLPGISDH